MVKTDDRTPCLFIQWAPLSEPDEVAEAFRAIGTSPALASLTKPWHSKVLTDQKTPKGFLQQLTREVSRAPGLQVLYLSAHGLPAGISFSQNGKPLLPYKKRFGELSTAAASSVVNMSLVIGACSALSDDSAFLANVSPFISRIYGFTGTPRASDVGRLLAAVLGNDMQLLANHSRKMAEVLAAPLQGTGLDRIDEAFARIRAGLDELLAAHEEAPAAMVRNRDGIIVRRWVRDVEGWTKTDFPFESQFGRTEAPSPRCPDVAMPI
jgi:hypothetical protein